MDASMDPSDLIGEQLFGEYTITSLLGEGAIGAVYQARHNTIGKDIAIKVLHERSARDEETVQRFEREALAISMLNHPNIIRVLIFGRSDEGLLYLAMEHVEGVPLRQFLTAEGLDEIQAIHIFTQLCSALQEAHDMGIIHRDLKPENILLTEEREEDNVVKILDFGMAKLLDTNEEIKKQKLSKSGVVYGTPGYVSPEQAQALELDHRSDIYSLGCILYETLAGVRPYVAKSAAQMLAAHVHEEPRPLSEVASGEVSLPMQRIIARAMAKDPDDRFQNARTMLHALRARQKELEVQQTADQRPSPAPPPMPDGDGEADAHTAPSPGANRITFALIWSSVGATAMFIVALIVATGIYFVG